MHVLGAIAASLLLLATTTTTTASAECLYARSAHLNARAPHALPDDGTLRSHALHRRTETPLFDYDAVKADLLRTLTDSQPFWPADNGHYGPLFIRLAWHCSGSYRVSDGRGGCDGGRIRFLPERAWADNTNLDKALTLLQPIKLKHGAALSWGDLIVLAGNVAIESMGGPVLGFCAGRRDDADGRDSLVLGPTPEQKALSPCEVNGNCTFPLGPTTVELIYVNPEGHMADGIPRNAVPDIRSSFSRMGMSDRETVALIGGGHAFGGMHGACPTGAGPSPLDSPSNPWPGTCGTGPLKGKANNTFTSGFQGVWTDTPTQWSNDYFHNLLEYGWAHETSPAGHAQFKPFQKPGGEAPPPGIRMLVSDMALLEDARYAALVREFAGDIKALESEFAKAWYKLTTRDMGPRWRCRGARVPPPQPFQLPLPPPPPTSKLPDFTDLRRRIVDVMGANPTDPDNAEGGPLFYGPLFTTLAYQCAATYRVTDHAGGCNGARIRFAPENTWQGNAGLDGVLAMLADVKALVERDGTKVLSWADLIVAAGTVGVEMAGVEGVATGWKGGRVDAEEKAVKENMEMRKLAPRTYIADPIVAVKDGFKVRGLTVRQGVALAARPRSRMLMRRNGQKSTVGLVGGGRVTSEYFRTLLGERWEAMGEKGVWRAVGKEVTATEEELAVVWDPEMRAVAEEFVEEEEGVLRRVFGEAWGLLMTADLP
ncbi:hypothetical protein HDU96_001330 [Phlyctochytrium bullatum]|nr:hypothetical protein HDU96_001330 [Phlyctochytrium bullatum]